MVLTVDTAYEGDDTFSLVESIRNTAEEYYPGTWYLAGEGVSTYDLMDTVTADMVKVNLVAIGTVFVVLLFTMKSLIAPIILVLSIETAIWINLSIPYFSDQTIFYIAYLIISSIQLGATVDYAILFTDRYKAPDLRKKGSRCADRFRCVRLRADLGQRDGGGGFPDGHALHPRSALAARLLFRERNALFSGYRAVRAAGAAVSVWQVYHPE